MRTFSSFSVFTLVCLGFALMLVGNTAEAQVEADLQEGTQVEVGKQLNVTFTLKDDSGNALPRRRVNFRIQSVVPRTPGAADLSRNSALTNQNGEVTIGVTPLRSGTFLIWATAVGGSQAAFPVTAGTSDPTKIVALPPNSTGLDGNGDVIASSNPDLAVGDTFDQQIWIKDVQDLSAWQMDIAFNPAILEAITVTQGDFLKDGDYVPFFTQTIDNTAGKITVRQARIGLKPNSSPPPPNMLLSSPPGVNGTGELLTIQFEVLEFAEESLGLHNVQLSDSAKDRISYYSVINPIVVTQKFPAQDVNRDGSVNILDLVAVAGSIGQADSINPRADVNDDGIVNILDLVAVYQHSTWGRDNVAPTETRDANAFVGAAPAASVGNITPETIQGWIDLAHMENDGSRIFKRGIANLEYLLHAKVPTETKLLPSETKLLRNYPNPFNPETWIPYQLAKSAEVTLTIYSVDGAPIRTLALGHQPAGLYQNRSRAAYWDGRNELGTQVTSGLYFYTFTADDFSATGKMLVRK